MTLDGDPSPGAAFQYAVGIDIGGTKVAVGIVEKSGRIVSRETMPTDSPKGLPDLAERVHVITERLRAQSKLSWSDIGGVGIGCPGPLNRQTGEIFNPHTLPGWETGSLTQCLHTRLGLPTILENDADAALLGECWSGAGRGTRCVVMLTFGTGVGGAVLTEDRIYRGLRDEHPEIGLIPILPDEPTDYSGVPGSLESLASGTGIGRAGQLYGFEDARAVFQAADEGHPDATCIIDRVRRTLRLACLTMAHTFCPERIILGGGLMEEHFGSLTQGVGEALQQATLLPKNQISVVPAKLGNLAGLVGAASLVFAPR